MFVYAITSHKGGVGKTTTTINLGAALQQAGKRILLIELDPHANLSAALRRNLGDTTISEVLQQPARICEAIQPCVQGMSLIPAVPTLAVTLLEIAQEDDSAYRLYQALQIVADRFDYTLIDCPSILSCAMTNGLAAADVALVPLQCDFLSLCGLADVQEMTASIRETINPHLRLRALGTMFDRRTSHASDVLKEARQALPGLIYNTVIPRSVRLAESPATGQTIMEYAPHSSGADAYRALARELLQEESYYGTTDRNQSGNAEAAFLLESA